MLPSCDLNLAAAIAERLRIGIAEEKMEAPECMISVSVSLGVSASDMEERYDGVCLVKAADSALYDAKRLGRNRVEAAKPRN